MIVLICSSVYLLGVEMSRIPLRVLVQRITALIWNYWQK